jgi:hypothetical protein
MYDSPNNGQLIYKNDTPVGNKSDIMWHTDMDIIGDIYMKFIGKSVRLFFGLSNIPCQISYTLRLDPWQEGNDVSHMFPYIFHQRHCVDIGSGRLR